MLVARFAVRLLLLFAVSLPMAASKTWFVRQDGGTRYSTHTKTGQCDGTADVAYPGRGVNQHCAFNDVRSMWLDTVGVGAGWVMSGGDTLVIRGCAALPTQQSPDAPHCRIGWDKATGNDNANFWCWYADDYCSMPPPPSGTANQHTRILGGCAYDRYSCKPVESYPYLQSNLTQLFAGFGLGPLMSLDGSKYVDLEGLELTTHNGKCTRVGYPQYPAACSTDRPMSDFARDGVRTGKTTSNILMQDVYIHGFTNNGISGPIGGPFTLNRVSIDFNAFAGWNFDDGHSTPDGPGSSITQSYVSMVGNGCLEEYPIVHQEFPAKACWDSNSGGFGDAWSGQDTPLDSFTCDHCDVRYNTKDGAIGPHTEMHYLSITNSSFVGNMGQQGKWGVQSNSKAWIVNNLIIGGCSRMAEQLPGAAQNFNLHTGLKGSYLSNFCRAAGDVFAFSTGANSNVQIASNTFVAQSATVFDLTCGSKTNCGSSPVSFTNNIYLGYTDPSYPTSNGQAPGLYYKSDPKVTIAGTYNLQFGVRNGDTCGHGGSICADPQLVGEPHQGRLAATALDRFNLHPSAASPAKGRGKALSGLTTDIYNQTRPNPPSIGAAEPAR